MDLSWDMITDQASLWC